MDKFNPQSLNAHLAEERRRAQEREAERRAKTLGYPYLNLISAKVPTEIPAMKVVAEEAARAASLVPLQLVRKKLLLACLDPARPTTQKLVESLKKDYEVSLVVVSSAGLEHGWSYYRFVSEEPKEISGHIEINDANLKGLAAKIKTLADVEKTIRDFKSPYTSQILEIVLASALALQASDIHLEPGETKNILRLRLDGLLHLAYGDFSQMVYRSLVTRLKLLSGLKLNIASEAQDGRFTIDLKDKDIEIRTSIIPSEYGETIVLRLLDPESLKTNLEELGWRPDDLIIVKKALAEPNGLILNTGPTGSGKTTTLYAFLRQVMNPEIKIITIEDPIEYHLPGISQTQVDPKAKYTFASGLRSILRQDPDIILIGEIRDNETADIAMNAALTGHLVFSTLHTNDAIGAIPRLIDLGIRPQILGPALSLVIAQRLVRRLCPHCRIARPLDKIVLEKIKEFAASLPERVDKGFLNHPQSYGPGGCDKCGGLGYRGRVSIFELFEISESIEQLIYKNPTEIEIKNLAKNNGMVEMQEDGIIKVFQGLTSQEEVERLTGPVAWLPDHQT